MSKKEEVIILLPVAQAEHPEVCLVSFLSLATFHLLQILSTLPSQYTQNPISSPNSLVISCGPRAPIPHWNAANWAPCLCLSPRHPLSNISQGAHTHRFSPLNAPGGTQLIQSKADKLTTASRSLRNCLLPTLAWDGPDPVSPSLTASSPLQHRPDRSPHVPGTRLLGPCMLCSLCLKCCAQ